MLFTLLQSKHLFVWNAIIFRANIKIYHWIELSSRCSSHIFSSSKDRYRKYVFNRISCNWYHTITQCSLSLRITVSWLSPQSTPTDSHFQQTTAHKTEPTSTNTLSLAWLVEPLRLIDSSLEGLEDREILLRAAPSMWLDSMSCKGVPPPQPGPGSVEYRVRWLIWLHCSRRGRYGLDMLG